MECIKIGVPLRQAIMHDMSKFLPSEWFPYTNYFYGIKDKNSFYYAWFKHQKRNKHHWQWWVLRLDDGGVKAVPMPDKYRREMLADWRGAGKAKGLSDNTKEWYLLNSTKMILHMETRTWIEGQLDDSA